MACAGIITENEKLVRDIDFYLICSKVILYKNFYMMNKKPELQKGDSYHAMGAFIFEEEGLPRVHAIKDKSDTTGDVLTKLPGGGLNPQVDVDAEIWLTGSMIPLLERAFFNSSEVYSLAAWLKDRERDMDIFDRTLLREYLGETGLLPVGYSFLDVSEKPNNKPGHTGKHYVMGYSIDQLITPCSRVVADTPKRLFMDYECCIVQTIQPDSDFVPVDPSILDPRLSLPRKDWMQLINGHKMVVAAAYPLTRYAHNYWPANAF